MSNSIYISFNDEPINNIHLEQLKMFILEILTELKHTNWDLSVLFCDDTFITQLNNQYRNINAPTDVLSFEQGMEYCDDNGKNRFNAGDIVISIDSLKFNSHEFNVTINDELKRLVLHGILHLSGMDHTDNSPEQEMLKLQENLLKLYDNFTIYRE